MCKRPLDWLRGNSVTKALETLTTSGRQFHLCRSPWFRTWRQTLELGYPKSIIDHCPEIMSWWPPPSFSRGFSLIFPDRYFPQSRTFHGHRPDISCVWRMYSIRSQVGAAVLRFWKVGLGSFRRGWWWEYGILLDFFRRNMGESLKVGSPLWGI